MATITDSIEALIADLDATIQEAFRSFIAAVNSPQVWGYIEDLLNIGDIDGALRIVESHIVRLADVVAQAQVHLGAATAQELNRQMSSVPIAISFDPSLPRAAALIGASRLNLIQELSEVQRAAVRTAIAEGFETGQGTFATARAFRNAIGLHSQQVRWAASFERRLRTLDPKALGMDLRDRRFDRTIRRAIERGRALNEDKIARMVERYRARALMYRSEMIARTEAVRATSQVRHEAMLQMVKQTGIDPNRVERVWNATKDNRVRDHHASMDGQTRGVEERFEDGKGNLLMYPGDPNARAPAGNAAALDTIINCRCSLTYRIKPPQTR